MLNIVIGLISLMISNIILGTSLSILNKDFDYRVLIKGLLKVIFIVMGM